MNNKFGKWGTLGLTALATLAFLAAGSFKLSGAEEMIQNFTRYGLPVGFMYFIGASEVAGAVGLWLPQKPFGSWPLKRLAAGGLAVIMVGAVVMHAINDPIAQAVPAVVLLAILSFLVFSFGKSSARSELSEAPVGA